MATSPTCSSGSGDFAVKGTHDLSLVDTDSFWITGFFEETKLAGIHIGDPAVAALMGFRAPGGGTCRKRRPRHQHAEQQSRRAWLGICRRRLHLGSAGTAHSRADSYRPRSALGWARHRPDRDGISRQGCQPRLVARFAIALVYAGRRLTCAAHSAMWSASQAVRTLHRRVANRRG